ncbi:MAG: GNAT family N-acetyltransferase [Planctomycetales bacterium]
MRIRPYQASDLEDLKSMTVEAFDGVSIDQGIERQFGEMAGHDWRWRKGRHVDADVARDPAGVFVLEQEGRPVGYISTSCDPETGLGQIANLVVIPELRGQGWGRRLVLHALDHFRRRGLSHAKIETLVQNDVGSALYRSVGFREVARQIHFVADLQTPDEG